MRMRTRRRKKGKKEERGGGGEMEGQMFLFHRPGPQTAYKWVPRSKVYLTLTFPQSYSLGSG